MNIDDFSPCINCKAKTCGLMDGNECSKSNEFERIKRIVENNEAMAKQPEHHEKKCFFCGDVAAATPVYAIDGYTSNGIIVCEHCLAAIRDIADEKVPRVPKERIRINRMYS